jgi:hypothetical protein
MKFSPMAGVQGMGAGDCAQLGAMPAINRAAAAME